MLYFKAVAPVAPGQLFEPPPVSTVAAALVTDRLVMPLAIKAERGWMLSPDYGATLDELPTTPGMWARALAALNELQRELIASEEALFDAGLQILDPAWIPDEFNNALTLHASLPAEHPLGNPAGILRPSTPSAPSLGHGATMAHRTSSMTWWHLPRASHRCTPTKPGCNCSPKPTKPP